MICHPKKGNILIVSFIDFFKTVNEAKKYPNLCRLGTSCGVLFASDELKFSNIELALILIQIEIIGVVGCIFYVWLQQKLEWNAKELILLQLTLLLVCPLWDIIGAIPNNNYFDVFADYFAINYLSLVGHYFMLYYFLQYQYR